MNWINKKPVRLKGSDPLDNVKDQNGVCAHFGLASTLTLHAHKHVYTIRNTLQTLPTRLNIKTRLKS